MMMKAAGSCVFSVLFIIVTRLDAGEVEPACIAKFKSVTQASALVTANRLNDIDFTFHVRVRNIDSSRKHPTSIVETDQRISSLLAKKRCLIEFGGHGQAKASRRVINERYLFAVIVEDVNKARFSLSAAIKNDDRNINSQLDDKFESVRDLVGIAHTLQGFRWDQILDSPDFQIEVAKFLGGEAKDDRPIRLEVRSLTGATKGVRYWAEMGPDPEKSFVIRRCGFKNPAGDELLRTVDYQSYGQAPFPRTIVTTIKSGPYMSEKVTTIEPPQHCTRPDAEFYLPSYGISESVVDVTRINLWVRIVALILSLIGVVASIYFYRLSRKSVSSRAVKS